MLQQVRFAMENTGAWIMNDDNFNFKWKTMDEKQLQWKFSLLQ